MVGLLKRVWTFWGLIWLSVTTLPLCAAVLLASIFKVSDHKLQWAPRWWARLLMWGIGCPVRTRGLENLEPGATYVFAGNHSSLLDIPALQSVLPNNFRWVAKQSLFSIPVFGRAMSTVGDIPIDRSAGRKAMQSLIQAARRVSQDTSVVIFPEGTRAGGAKLLPFKSGGFLLAIKSQRPVVPFYIEGTYRALPYERLVLTPGAVQVRFGPPIATSGSKADHREELSETARQSILRLQDGENSGPTVDREAASA